eukprot:14159130-Alexandrium_andersonii.AAC.1
MPVESISVAFPAQRATSWELFPSVGFARTGPRVLKSRSPGRRPYRLPWVHGSLYRRRRVEEVVAG